jgi:hypothetical protein
VSEGLRIVAHAIQRYQERYRPDASPQQIEDELEALVYIARPTRDRTPKGEEIWQAEGVLFCVRRDRSGPVAVTVLPKDSADRGRAVNCFDGIPEAVLEEFEERGTFDQGGGLGSLQRVLDTARNRLHQLQTTHTQKKRELEDARTKFNESRAKLDAARVEYEKLLKNGFAP